MIDEDKVAGTETLRRQSLERGWRIDFVNPAS